MEKKTSILSLITLTTLVACGGEESYPPPCGEGTVERGGVCYALPTPIPEVTPPSLACGEGTEENNGFCIAKSVEPPEELKENGSVCADDPNINAPCIEASTGLPIKGKFSCEEGELVCKPEDPSPEKCDGYFDEDQDGELDEGCPLSECASETDCMSGLSCAPFNTGSPEGICVKM